MTRRIERGAGSAYKANGREMRARDVQTLFADMASGAHSTAMVSQGRVSALVNAKPEARRQVLEEAAGITGLHARRHEAELKLRAAEANLSKAEDLRAQLELSRASRCASRPARPRATAIFPASCAAPKPSSWPCSTPAPRPRWRRRNGRNRRGGASGSRRGGA